MSEQTRQDSALHMLWVKAHYELGGQYGDTTENSNYEELFFYAVNQGWYELAELGTRVVDYRVENEALDTLLPELLHKKAWREAAMAADNVVASTVPSWFSDDGETIPTNLNASYSTIVGVYTGYIQAADTAILPAVTP